MSDDLTFRRRAIDHPGSVPCPHCGEAVALPKTEPWIVAEGAEIAPQLESLRCPHCRTRIYLQPVNDAQREWDAEQDALEDDDTSTD